MNQNEQIKLLWDTHQNDIKLNTETAEKYFTDALKLIINLSTGLLAFIVAIHNEILKNILKYDIIILTFSFIGAIVLAMIAFALLAANYKTYADNHHKSLQDLYRNLQTNSMDKIQEQNKKVENEFLNSKDGGWQYSTMSLGIISFSLFTFGTSYLMVCFILSKF